MKTTTVATFNDRSPAELFKTRLEESHIKAEIHRQDVMERLWFVRKPLAVFRVDVLAEDYDIACKLLQTGTAPGAPLRCPECGSSRIEYPQFTRKFILPNLIGLLAAIGLVDKEYYCQECHYTWPRDGAKPRKPRHHMAPNYFIDGVEEVTAQTVEPAGKVAR